MQEKEQQDPEDGEEKDRRCQADYMLTRINA